MVEVVKSNALGVKCLVCETYLLRLECIRPLHLLLEYQDISNPSCFVTNSDRIWESTSRIQLLVFSIFFFYGLLISITGHVSSCACSY
jgi:hypothetical protein